MGLSDKQRAAKVRATRAALKKTTRGYTPTGVHWRTALRLLDELERDLDTLAAPAPGWTTIGPVQPGGTSLLDMVLTHATAGIPLFPAVDTAWGGGGGVTVIAPQACVVDTKDTSARPGEAVYLTLSCRIRLWVGHLDRDWPLGHRFKKGDVIGKTLPIPGSSDHAHIGVNVEALLGVGKQLRYGRTGRGPDYTLGAPTIRAQLAKALS